MPLRFQPPQLPQVKSKTAAFTEGIQPGLTALSNLPSTIAYFQAHKQEMDQKKQALALQERQTQSQFGTGAAPAAPLTPGAEGPTFQESPDQMLQRVGTQGVDAKAKLEALKQKDQPTWIIDEKGNKVGEVPAGVKVEKLAAPYQALVPTYDTEGNVTGFTKAEPGAHVVGGGKPANPKLAQEKPKAEGSLKDTLREYDNMINEAEAIKNDPGVGMATGMTKYSSAIPGTQSKRVAARLETLKAKTLLNVLGSLKALSKTGASGFGQLSEIEGENIRNSVSTLDRGLSTQDFKDSIDRFVTEMKAKKQTLQDTFDSTYGGSNGAFSSPDVNSIPTVSDKKAYDALPNGAQYQDASGHTYRKK